MLVLITQIFRELHEGRKSKTRMFGHELHEFLFQTSAQIIMIVKIALIIAYVRDHHNPCSHLCNS